MKIERFLVAFAFVLGVTLTPVFAQTRPAAGAAPAQTPPTSTGNVPESKVAVIYSEAFLDAKTGIARFGALAGNLNREFQPRQTELTNLQTKMQQLSDDINKTKAVADPKTIAQKQDQLDAMNTEYKRKYEDAQAAFEKRRKEIFLPLQDDIAKALEVYAKAHNINVIIDGSQVPLVYAADALDITRAFINEYNSKNPATAAVTAPAPK